MKTPTLILIAMGIGATSCIKEELRETPIDIQPLKSGTVVFDGLMHSPFNNTILYISPGNELVAENFGDGGVNIHLQGECIWKAEIEYEQLPGQKITLSKATDSSVTFLLNIMHFSSTNAIYPAEGDFLVEAFLDATLVYSKELVASGDTPIANYNGNIEALYWTVHEIVGINEEIIAIGFTDTTGITLADGTYILADKILLSRNSSPEHQQPSNLQLSGEDIYQLLFRRSVADDNMCGDIWDFDENIRTFF